MSALRRLLELSIVAGGVVVLDQAVKAWISGHMILHESREIIGDFVRLTFVLNPNAVLGIPIPSVRLYHAFALLAVGLLVVLTLREPHRRYRLLYGLILGGAVGNLLDRLRIGAVVDFVDVGIGRVRWPVFNLADSAISVALLLLLWFSLRHQEAPHPVEEFPYVES